MKKTIQVLAIAVMATTLGLSSLVYAQDTAEVAVDKGKMFEHKKEMKKKHMEKMKEELGLTDEQDQQLQAYHEAHREQEKQYRESTKELRNQIKNEFEKTDFDESVVRGLNEQIKDIKNKSADHRLEGMIEVRKILTETQFKKFMELKGKREGKWNKMHEDHPKDFKGPKGHEGFNGPEGPENCEGPECPGE